MRYDEFFTWMQTERVRQEKDTPRDASIKGYIVTLRAIADAERINFDTEFRNDRLISLLQRYTYPIRNERNGVPDPTSLGLPLGGLTAILRSHKFRINHYRKFCEAINPPNM